MPTVQLVDGAGGIAEYAAGTTASGVWILHIGEVLTTDDLIGSTITFALRERRTGREVLAAKAVDGFDNALKTVQFTITKVEGQDFPAGWLSGDVKVLLAGGDERNHGPYEFKCRRTITP